MEYGLIGEKLGHSFSKIIHEKLADYTYELHPLEKDAVADFMKEKSFRAINVTIPYKREVMAYLDEIDPAAEKIGAVNTVVNQNGILKGYNTDYSGFLYMVRARNVDMKDKEVLILGNGGAAQAVKAAVRSLGAAKLFVADLEDPGNEPDFITYDQVQDHYDVDIIVNCTPVGMYPNSDAQIIQLRNFSACQAVFDVIYNPLKSRLLLEAEEMGITAVNGLGMLVAQAKYAVEFFLSTQIPDAKIDEILYELTYDLSNIVLIGMPSCGKTLTGRALESYISKRFVDADAEIIRETGMEIREIFETGGEAEFRRLETDMVADLAKQNRLIIATGGGVVKNPENMKRLKQNGIVIFIDRDLDKLISTSDRPLSSSKDAIRELYKQRYPLYLAYGDFRIENNYVADELSKEEMDELMNGILEGYREIVGNQWT